VLVLEHVYGTMSFGTWCYAWCYDRAMAICELRAGSPGLPAIVCVHPVAGRCDAYRPLAAALAWPGRVLGIDAPAPAGDHDPGYRLSELARRYVDELDPRAPAILLGWSVGGTIAAEMTRVLAARGVHVALLGVLDARAHTPEMRQRPTDTATLARSFVYQRALEHEQAPPVPPASGEVATVLATLRAAGLAADLEDDRELERRLAVYMALTRAFLLHHEQHTIPATVHVFDAQDAHPSHPKPPTLGWENHAPRVERHAVPGTHFTLLRPRHVPELARVIATCLPQL
jgi:thioesterase domain-containing protein